MHSISTAGQHLIGAAIFFSLFGVVPDAASAAAASTCAVSVEAFSGKAPDSTQADKIGQICLLLDAWSGGDGAPLQSAKALIDELLADSPDYVPAHHELARYYLKNGYGKGKDVRSAAYASAERALDRALQINPRYADAYVLRGYIQAEQGNLEPASQALARAAELGTKNPWLYWNIGLVLEKQYAFRDALAGYQRVLSSDTKNERARAAAQESSDRLLDWVRRGKAAAANYDDPGIRSGNITRLSTDTEVGKVATSPGYQVLHLTSYERSSDYCMRSNPVVDDLAKRHRGRAKFYRVSWSPWWDMDEKIEKKFDVHGVPTVIVFHDGKELGRRVGVDGISALDSWLEKLPR